jgi:CRP/FNR family cyclic AMP-dependent transcriptional regulator
MSSAGVNAVLTRTSAGSSRAALAICSQVLKSAIGDVDSHVYPAGMELFRQDASPGDIYFVETGLAKLTRYEENGSEFILDIRFPGSLLGSEAAIQRKPHPFSAVTATNCRLTRLSAKRFLDLLRTELRLGQYIHDLLSDEVLNQAARMSEIACLPARKRLEQLLWKIAEQAGEERAMDLRVQLPVKYWEAAQLLAITPTYLSRLLAELESEEIISRRNGWIIVRKPTSLWHRVDL